MTPLEKLAEELFVRFAKQESNVEANWAYLNNVRKIAWMDDVLLIADHVLNDLQNTVKPLEPASKVATSYEMGYNQGRGLERTQFITVLEKYRADLNDDLDIFKEQMTNV